jgi:hypothetical protein
MAEILFNTSQAGDCTSGQPVKTCGAAVMQSRNQEVLCEVQRPADNPKNDLHLDEIGPCAVKVIEVRNGTHRIMLGQVDLLTWLDVRNRWWMHRLAATTDRGGSSTPTAKSSPRKGSSCLLLGHCKTWLRTETWSNRSYGLAHRGVLNPPSEK